jgi:hypothetical protein
LHAPLQQSALCAHAAPVATQQGVALQALLQQ